MCPKHKTRFPTFAETVEGRFPLTQLPRTPGTWTWKNRYGFIIEELDKAEAKELGLTCGVPKCPRPTAFIINVGELELNLCFPCMCNLHSLFAFRLWGLFKRIETKI
jgi:hypothetical protein